MRILLLWPKSRNEVLGWGDLGAVAEPLALEYLAAGAQLDAHVVRILDLRLHPDALDDALAEFQPDVVGVTAFSMHVRSALELCRRVKALRPIAWTVVGGHHATLLPEDFFEPAVDFVVQGEGVAPFRSLLATLADGARAPAVAGVWARSDARFVRAAPPAELAMDELPVPDRVLTELDRHEYFIDWMKPVALLRTTVGCPYRCTFCSLWTIMDGKYHIRDIDRVVEEVASLREEFVFLVDDEAFIHGPRMRRLAEALRQAGFQKRFFTYCRIDSLIRQREAVAAWRAIGLERLFIGIDGISTRELDAYNKRVKVAQIEAGLALARDLGIEVFAQFVVNPDYDRRDFERLVRFIEHQRIRYPSFTVLTPLPGTELLRTFDAVVERQPNGRPNWDLFDCQNAVTRTRLPKDEFRRAYRNLYRVFKGSYLQYREHEHNQLIDRWIHDGDVGAWTETTRPPRDTARARP